VLRFKTKDQFLTGIWYDRSYDACALEALACRDSLRQYAIQLGVQRVELETDCLHLVQLWNKKDAQRSIIDPVLTEIDDLRLAFQEFFFSYISRLCNKEGVSLFCP
jgi:hypothetical protein